MGVFSIFRNVKKRGLKDVTDPKRWAAYFNGQEIKKEGLHLTYEQIVPFTEMLMFRMLTCPECVQRGACTHCECPMPLKAMWPDDFCSAGKWTEFNSVEDWEKYKKSTNLKFNISYE